MTFSVSLNQTGNCLACQTPFTENRPALGHEDGITHRFHKECLWQRVNNCALMEQNPPCLLCDRKIVKIDEVSVPNYALNPMRFFMRVDPNHNTGKLFQNIIKPYLERDYPLSLLSAEISFAHANGTLSQWFLSDVERGIAAELMAKLPYPLSAPVQQILETGPIPLQSRIHAIGYALGNFCLDTLSLLIREPQDKLHALRIAIATVNQDMIDAMLSLEDRDAMLLIATVYQDVYVVNYLMTHYNFSEHLIDQIIGRVLI